MNLKLHSKNANHNSFISKLPIIPKPVDVANETAKQKGFSLGSTFNDDWHRGDPSNADPTLQHILLRCLTSSYVILRCGELWCVILCFYSRVRCYFSIMLYRILYIIRLDILLYYIIRHYVWLCLICFHATIHDIALHEITFYHMLCYVILWCSVLCAAMLYYILFYCIACEFALYLVFCPVSVTLCLISVVQYLWSII